MHRSPQLAKSMLHGPDKAGENSHPNLDRPTRLALFGFTSSHIRTLGPVLGSFADTTIVYCDDPVTSVEHAGSLPIYDVAAIDIDTGPASTSNPIRILCNQHPVQPVIGITEREEIKTICLAIDAGAAGVLHIADIQSGNFDFHSITVGASLASLSPRIARTVLNELRDDNLLALRGKPADPVRGAAPPGTLLSVREREILRLSAAGMIGREIANHLSVSPHTIATHFKNIYRKLGVSTRGEAVFKAHRAGLI